MSETILRFFADELKTVRILCQAPNCQGVVEYPVNALRVKMAGGFCPLCNKKFAGPGGGSVIAEIGKVMEWLEMARDDVRVEFVLPVK